MLIKRADGRAAKQRLSTAYQGLSGGGMDRRGFLRQAGLGGAGLAALGSLGAGRAQAANEATPVIEDRNGPLQRIKNVCTHCSVGCTVTAEVRHGTWVGQEPSYDSPINRGTHCAKGASVRELVHGDRRLKYPMKLVGGQWQRIGWDTAISEISAKLLDLRDKA
ncbi:MAG: formate dehydrogenase, partial [Belnapia sp.]|nr:formate dehydrogenase [Belnapia sp.]